jgi:hypothetical protein
VPISKRRLLLLLIGLLVIACGIWVASQRRSRPTLTPPTATSNPALARVPTAQQSQSGRPERQAVERLLSLPSFERLALRDSVLITQVRQNPSPYLAELRSIYPDSEIPKIPEPDSVLRFQRAIALLTIIGTDESRSQLAHWYQAVARAADDPAYRLQRDANLQRQRILLSALGSTQHKQVVSDILDRLDALDYATLVAALQYLARSSRGDADVIRILRRYSSDRSSTLYGSQDLKRTLSLITKPG